ncbi:choice-of-anchor I family protein [Glycomyces xiaoerkulensis]|uniref:choice-of-anchor I family protein n=1 Tax=Glycomyces xiaoerkulensis TaxID=2038139 RepID=UPI0012FFF785|nr:choice-of-anchor I family protein [Glycomyces xiaoerkulensis]
MRKRLFIPALAVGLTAAAFPTAFADAQDGAGPAIELTALGSYANGSFDASAAEIVAYDAGTRRLFVVNAEAGVVDVLDASDPAHPEKLFEIDASAAVEETGWTVNSVAVHDGLVAVAAEPPVKTDTGRAILFTADGEPVDHVPAGALPDSVAFTPGGGHLLVAGEGEPADDYSADPPGTVTVVDTADFTAATADFTAWDGTGAPDGVRVFGPEGTLETDDAVSTNLEPEYIVAADEHTAYVTLQENNAIAVLDVDAAEITAIHPLGVKDHLLEGNELDASNRDDAIDIAPWPVYGYYLPDGFDLHTAGGETYLVTANEGDARDWDAYSEEARVADLELCADADRFAGMDLAELQAEEHLGRLKVTTSAGLTESGCYDELYSYGGRSFSIWTADGELVFDSGSDFERIIAETHPDHFNADNDENEFDSRSDDKGPEPEDVAVGAVGDRTYAFIGLERQGGIMIYDITDPASASFVDYGTERDFAVEPGEGDAGDLAPESIVFIDGDRSPTGRPMLAVGNEVSGTTTLFDITGGEPGDAGGEEGGESADPGTGALPDTGSTATGLLAGAAGALALAGGVLLLARRRGRADA